MDGIKWIQLISSSLLILLPAVIHYRNWKYHDRRTKVHNLITKLLLICWGASALGIAFVNYKTLSATQPLPNIEYVINRVPVKPEEYVTIPSSNGLSRIILRLGNDGQVPAENIHVAIHFPTNVFVIQYDEGWQKKSGLLKVEDFLKDAPYEALNIDNQQKLLPVKEYTELPQFTLQNTNYGVIGFYVSVSDRHKTWPTAHFNLHFNPGPDTNSYPGYRTN